ncbi:TonB-dependent receptor plug domain-containing protein, partial [Kaarinaea lacus]
MQKITQKYLLMKPRFSVLLVLLLWSAFCLAEETGITNSETNTSSGEPVDAAVEAELDTGQTDAVLQELIQLLDQETELATKSKINVDFVPGIMSVLHGKDMLARGVENVYQALGLVPGIEISRTNDGQPQILVRGIGKAFFSSKVKFLLNNTSFNATLGAATTLLILPIEQVERIEVIRGPGSAIYGEYASVGVINIITRKKETALFGRVNELDKYTLGGMYSKQIPDKNLSFNISVSQVKAEGGDVDAGPDVLYGTPQQGISNAPGPINNEEAHHSLLLDINFKDYLLSYQRVKQGIGDYFGLANALPSDQRR